ncbi:MAG TPA: hypothetical protein VKV16_02160, partial [Solirubrobacteraceae bacterium]|nr:hypothetical protein [Solirubrobacteraceae bacterium]
MTSASALAAGDANRSACPPQTEASSGFQAYLPDCRAYEMVSPANNDGYDAPPDNFDFFDTTWLNTRSAASGDAFVFDAQSLPGTSAGDMVSYYLAERGAAGWSSRSITPPAGNHAGTFTEPYSALAFTPELTSGVLVDPESLTSESPSGQWNLYVANLAEGGFRAVTNVTPPESPEDSLDALPNFGAASADLDEVVFSDNAKLTPEAPAGATSLYAWVDGDLHLVSFTPEGVPMPEGAQPGAGQPPIDGSCVLCDEGDGGAIETHAVSEDGD